MKLLSVFASVVFCVLIFAACSGEPKITSGAGTDNAYGVDLTGKYVFATDMAVASFGQMYTAQTEGMTTEQLKREGLKPWSELKGEFQERVEEVAKDYPYFEIRADSSAALYNFKITDSDPDPVDLESTWRLSDHTLQFTLFVESDTFYLSIHPVEQEEGDDALLDEAGFLYPQFAMQYGGEPLFFARRK